MSSAAMPKRLPVSGRIRWARTLAGLSLDRLADQVGTSRRHLIRLEKGEHRPKPDLAARIAEATGQPRKLFDDEDEESEPLDILTVLAPLARLLQKAARA